MHASQFNPGGDETGRQGGPLAGGPGDSGRLPQAARDALEGLLDGERSSMIAELTPDLPVVARSSEHMRGLLLGFASERRRREEHLAAALGLLPDRGLSRSRSAGTSPPAPRADPFLPLLSLRFVLLKAHEALTLLETRYANSAQQVTASPAAGEMVAAHTAELRSALARLTKELTAMGLEPSTEP